MGNCYSGDGACTIEDSTLVKCSKMAETFEIPDGVKSIGPNAFSNCKLLVAVTIPNSVTTIGESAFLGCKSLTSLTILGDYTYFGTSDAGLSLASGWLAVPLIGVAGGYRP